MSAVGQIDERGQLQKIAASWPPMVEFFRYQISFKLQQV